jgi:hypothetical protein
MKLLLVNLLWLLLTNKLLFANPSRVGLEASTKLIGTNRVQPPNAII